MRNNTFSFKVKKELSENMKEISLSETLGIFFLNKKVSTNNIIFSTENSVICTYITKLLAEKLSVIVNLKKKIFSNKESYILTIPYLSDRLKILKLLKKNYEFKSVHSKASFIKGIFIANGTMIDPKYDYHLEFISYSEILAKNLQDFLKSVNKIEVNPKIIKRRNNYIVYIKGSEEIINLLTFIGATSCSMELMQIKMLKELRNQVNRTTNFETANITKVAKVSATQIEKINKIKDSLGLENLPDDLKKLADLRLSNPEMSLKDLGENMIPKLSRSGVYHRMQRLLNYKI